MPNFRTPGVYIQENQDLPPSVVGVETAIPVFIGYTEKARLKEGEDLLNVPKRITSLKEYDQFFGGADPEKGFVIDVNTQKSPVEIIPKITTRSNYLMFYSLQAYYANGGGPCYIVSIGDYSGGGVINKGALLGGLEEAGKVDEITLIVYPDGTNMTPAADYYAMIKQSLDQCSILHDRFTVCDVYIQNDPTIDDVDFFRATLSGTLNELKYGAAYYPYLEMQLDYQYNAKEVTVNKDGTVVTLDILEAEDNALFKKLKNYINSIPLILSPSSAIVGIYAQIDNKLGVWKAPANVNVDMAVKPTLNITHEQHGILNVDVNAGKSINAIRSFEGRGPAMVWGARTLAGNDNEWRYIPVRRFFNMVEESVKKATYKFVFEPNDSGTWIKIQTMIENFLMIQWQLGALRGLTPEAAYFVRVGLGQTMTALDVKIGMAVVCPAEFIILRFMQKMQEA